MEEALEETQAPGEIVYVDAKRSVVVSHSQRPWGRWWGRFCTRPHSAPSSLRWPRSSADWLRAPPAPCSDQSSCRWLRSVQVRVFVGALPSQGRSPSAWRRVRGERRQRRRAVAARAARPLHNAPLPSVSASCPVQPPFRVLVSPGPALLRTTLAATPSSVPTAFGLEVRMDSTKRKRARAMNKHKYKKLMKKMRNLGANNQKSK